MAEQPTEHKSNKDELFIARLAQAYQIKTKPGLEKLKKFLTDTPEYKYNLRITQGSHRLLHAG